MHFAITTIRNKKHIPDWVTNEIRDKLEDCNFENMRDEGRAVLLVKLGDKIKIHFDGGEPEDNTFWRDWHWVSGLIKDAYEAGYEFGRRDGALFPS